MHKQKDYSKLKKHLFYHNMLKVTREHTFNLPTGYINDLNMNNCSYFYYTYFQHPNQDCGVDLYNLLREHFNYNDFIILECNYNSIKIFNYKGKHLYCHTSQSSMLRQEFADNSTVIEKRPHGGFMVVFNQTEHRILNDFLNLKEQLAYIK